MVWWAWVIGGAILLGAELAFVDAQFYLVFIGSAALVSGLAAALFPALADWAQWALFAALAIGSMATFRSRVYALVRGRPTAVPAGPVGGHVTVPATLAPGASCQAEHAGSFWTVRNEGSVPIAPGGSAKIVGVQGLTLIVHPDTQGS